MASQVVVPTTDPPIVSIEGAPPPLMTSMQGTNPHVHEADPQGTNPLQIMVDPLNTTGRIQISTTVLPYRSTPIYGMPTNFGAEGNGLAPQFHE